MLGTNNAGTFNFASGSALGLDTTAGDRASSTIITDVGANVLGLTKLGANTLTLTGANTYSGQTRIQEGTLSVSSLNNVAGAAANSSLGRPVTYANGTIALGSGATTGTLLYTGGVDETTDRVIDLAGTTGGAIISQAGYGNGNSFPTTRGTSGLLKFTSNLTAPGTAAVDNRVVAIAPIETVVALAAFDRVPVVAAEQCVVAAPAAHRVFAVAAVEMIGAGATEHRVMTIDLGAFGGSALTDTHIAVPEGPGADDGIPVTYVPARNTVFLSFALAWSEVLGAIDQSEQIARHKVVSRADVQAAVRQARAEGKRIGFTNGCFDILHHGHVQLLEAAAKECDLLVVGVNSDVTEFRKYELALRESKNRMEQDWRLLRTLIDGLPMRIYVKDLQSRFTVVNKAFARRVGYSNPDDVIGKTDFDVGNK
jgi:cytidyltransferase-like protein